MSKSIFISIVIPTFNAEKFLQRCLESIKKQDYPRSSYEVLVIDGGSDDQTLNIAKSFNCVILKNPFKDAESGKSIGIEKARGEIIALIDADNELVEGNWLRIMVKPLEDDKDIFGVESTWYLKEKDPLINQYATLLQIADPLARRFHPKMKIENRGEYDVLHLKTGQTPVIGANGFLWRKKYIKVIGKYKPKFEEVNYISLMVEHGYLVYAKVKYAGIYHYYCLSLMDYLKKRVKIGRKFMARKLKGQETWIDQSAPSNFVLEVIYNLSIVGPLMEAITEYRKSGKIAWFWHPIISFLTIMVYAYIYIEARIKFSLSSQKN